MIPVPLLWKVKLSIKRKLIIGLLLCSGVFIMIATLLRCILSLRDIQGINISTIWAIRETVSTGISVLLAFFSAPSILPLPPLFPPQSHPTPPHATTPHFHAFEFSSFFRGALTRHV